MFVYGCGMIPECFSDVRGRRRTLAQIPML